MKILRRVVASAAGGLFALATLAPPAYAHAAYKDSSPKSGETVSSPPSEVWAEFTEEPTEESRLEIYDPCGERVDAGDYRIDPLFDRITVSMSATATGSYRVDWFVISDQDAHPTTGTFKFASSGGSQCAQENANPGGGDKKPGKSGGGDDPSPGDAASSSAGGQEPSSSGSQPLGPRSESRGMTKPNSKGSGEENPRKKGSVGSSTNSNSNLAQGGGRGEQSVADQAADIPLDGLLIAFGMSMLIGAAGGRMYAGIMGPRR